jgi:hypothetical protein
MNNELVKQVEEVEHTISDRHVLEIITTYEIHDDKQYAEAGVLVKTAKGILDEAEGERKKITGPLNVALKEVNDRFKAFVAPLETARDGLRKKMGVYADEKACRDAEERRRVEAELLAAAEKAEARSDIPTATKILNTAVDLAKKPAVKAVSTGGVTTTSRKMYEGFVVEDFAKVPEGYKIVDEAKVRDAYRNSVRDIPGLKIIEKTVIVTR